MGFFRKLLGGEEKVDEDIRAARARHGIATDGNDNKKDECSPQKPEYDPWEEVGNARRNLFLGSWASKKIFRPKIDHDAIKEELAEIDRKRQEKKEKKE